MKKCILGLLLFSAGFLLYAQTTPTAAIFVQPITGVGRTVTDNKFINQMLANEISTRGYSALKTPFGADLVLYGSIIPYYKYEMDLVRIVPVARTYSYNSSMQADGERYVFQLILKNDKTKETLLQQNLTYASFEDVYNFFPVMMYNLFNVIAETGIDRSVSDWQNKWLYLRLSFDFPITFYLLQEKGLINGTGMYAGDYKNPTGVSPLDNKVVALPAGTAGIELQFLNFLSIEPIFQIGWEHLNEQDFMTMAAGVEVKVPLKFSNIMLEPYGAVSIPIPASREHFALFPKVGFGGGAQVGLKGGKSGAVFFDINYMYYYGDVGMNNPFTDDYPNPAVIYYKRSVIGLSAGYKFGFITRN